MQRKPVLRTEDTPFLSNNVLKNRNPRLSFYMLAVQMSSSERFGSETEHWVWALTRLAQTWIKSSWEGQRCWRTATSASKGKDPPPAWLCSPVYQTLQFWLQVFYRQFPPSPMLSCCLSSSFFSIAEDQAHHTTAAARGFCWRSLPCRRTSSFCAD